MFILPEQELVYKPKKTAVMQRNASYERLVGGGFYEKGSLVRDFIKMVLTTTR